MNTLKHVYSATKKHPSKTNPQNLRQFNNIAADAFHAIIRHKTWILREVTQTSSTHPVHLPHSLNQFAEFSQILSHILPVFRSHFPAEFHTEK